MKMDEKNIVKTGTTILGIVCKDGVVMAGDNRASLGTTLVGGKDLLKVLSIHDYLLVAVAGHATEAIKTSKLLAAELKLKQLKSKSRPSVKEAASLLSNIPVQASGFLVGGFDEDGGISLYEIIGGLSIKVSDYSASIGSGLMYVLGYLERMWKPEVTVKEGIELAKESIKASMERDLATGNGMNIFTITKEGIKEVVRDKTELTFKKR
jgi:proteasome beta subunit